MNYDFNLTVTKPMAASTAQIWHALTDPTEVKQWMFGTTVASSWKKGAPITYSGEWNGNPYQDHGVILEIVSEKLLKTSYFSPLSGKKDVPENYNIITYEITPKGEGAIVTLTQENCASQEEADSMAKNWRMTLDALAAQVAKA